MSNLLKSSLVIVSLLGFASPALSAGMEGCAIEEHCPLDENKSRFW